MSSVPPPVSLTSRFSGDSPISAAQGRHGELIIAQGGGVRPARWSGVGPALDAGVDAPTAPPAITVNSPAQYYVARIDVTKPGACYYSPPEVTLSLDGSKERDCKAAAYLSQSTVSEVRVLDGGKGYTNAPAVELSDSHGKGALIEAVLDIPSAGGPVDPTNNPQTGLSQWEIVEQPPADSDARFAALDNVRMDIPINGNGTFTVPHGGQFVRKLGGQTVITGCNPAANPGYTLNVTYTVSGYTTGSGAILRLTWTGGVWLTTIGGFGVGAGCAFFLGAKQPRSARVRRYGAGYSDTSTITVTINAIDGDTTEKVVISGVTAGNENNTDAPRYPVRELRLRSGGSGYLVAPQLKFVSNSGFGAYGTCKVKNGVITEVTLENSGGGYKTAPTVEIVSGGAEVFAVSRPHLRGTYQCYYRYTDDTAEDKGGPIPSNLSPVLEVDAGEGAASLTWTVPPPEGRAKKLELWRTTGDQATALYRVAVIDTSSGNPPTGISLSPASIAENNAINAVVGTLATTDADAGDTFTYALVAGDGSTDNASFTIAGDKLRVSVVLNYEAKTSYAIRVRSTDRRGLFVEQAFTVSVTNANEAPTDISLSPASIAENAGANAVVGTLSTIDPDAGNTHTYTLVTGTGATDNAAFNISGNQLRANASFVFAVKSAYSVRVRSTDQAGLFTEKAFAVTVVQAAVPGCSACDGNLVNNGSFTGATRSVALWGWDYVAVDLKALNVWNAESADGSYSVDLNATSDGWLRQTLATLPGAIYKVRFLLQGNFDGNQTINRTCRVTAAGASQAFTVRPADWTYRPGGSIVWPAPTDALTNWLPKEFEFQATSTSTALTFESTMGGGVYGCLVDCVCVTLDRFLGGFTFGEDPSSPHPVATAPGGVIGKVFNIVDPFGGSGPYTITLHPVSGTNVALFAVAGNSVITTSLLPDYTQTQYVFRVRVTNTAGQVVAEYAHGISLPDNGTYATEPGFSLARTYWYYPASAGSGLYIGDLLSAGGNNPTFTLVSGNGSQDNSMFYISNNKVYANQNLVSSRSFRIRHTQVVNGIPTTIGEAYFQLNVV